MTESQSIDTDLHAYELESDEAHFLQQNKSEDIEIESDNEDPPPLRLQRTVGAKMVTWEVDKQGCESEVASQYVNSLLKRQNR